MENNLKVCLFNSFTPELLKLFAEHKVRQIERRDLPQVAMGAPIIVEVIKEGGWIGGLALVLMTWLRNARFRKVKITKKNGKVEEIEVRGYKVDDVERIIEEADRIDIIEISQSQPRERYDSE